METELIKIGDCNHLVKDPRSSAGYYCATHQLCEHINNLSYVCPIINYARDYESGKFKRLEKNLIEKTGITGIK